MKCIKLTHAPPHKITFTPTRFNLHACICIYACGQLTTFINTLHSQILTSWKSVHVAYLKKLAVSRDFQNGNWTSLTTATIYSKFLLILHYSEYAFEAIIFQNIFILNYTQQGHNYQSEMQWSLMLNTRGAAYKSNIQHLHVTNEMVTRNYRPVFKWPPTNLWVYNFSEQKLDNSYTNENIKNKRHLKSQ